MNAFCSKLFTSGASLIECEPGVSRLHEKALRDAVLEMYDQRVVIRIAPIS